MLDAHQQWVRQQRDAAAIAELPVAQLTALMANINRDPKKTEAFTALQFCLYRESDRSDEVFSPAVAAVALALRHEDQCPALLLAVWPQILASARPEATMPEVRALHSDDGAVWVLAPTWEGQHCRGGLVAVKGQISGPILLRDLDRPLLIHRLQLPQRSGFGWLEAGMLLLAES